MPQGTLQKRGQEEGKESIDMLMQEWGGRLSRGWSNKAAAVGSHSFSVSDFTLYLSASITMKTRNPALLSSVNSSNKLLNL